MIIYVDVLVIVNFIVNYLLLLLTAHILKIKYRLIRLLLGSFLGALSSLYIFFPEKSGILDFLFKLIISASMVVISFKLKGIKLYIKCGATLFIISFIYVGVVGFFYKTFSPYNLIVYNSVVYFNISSGLLIALTVGYYLVFTLLARIFKTASKTAENATVEFFYENERLTVNGIIDSGNSIEDAFSKNDVIIVDERVITRLLKGKDIEDDEFKTRFRIIPCVTVSSTDYLKGFRCDKANIESGNKKIKIKNPILAVSKTKLPTEFNAIINPQIFEYIGELNEI